MRMNWLRWPLLMAGVAVLIGGALPTLAETPETTQAEHNLPQAQACAMTAQATSPAGLIKALVEQWLFTPVAEAFRSGLGAWQGARDGNAAVPAEEVQPGAPVFAGGAGGDEPAGPWP